MGTYIAVEIFADVTVFIYMFIIYIIVCSENIFFITSITQFHFPNYWLLYPPLAVPQRGQWTTQHTNPPGQATSSGLLRLLTFFSPLFFIWPPSCHSGGHSQSASEAICVGGQHARDIIQTCRRIAHVCRGQGRTCAAQRPIRMSLLTSFYPSVQASAVAISCLEGRSV